MRLKNLIENFSTDELKSSITDDMIEAAKQLADIILSKNFKNFNWYKYSAMINNKEISFIITNDNKNTSKRAYAFYLNGVNKNDRNIYLDFRDKEVKVSKDLIVRDIIHELVHWFDEIDYEGHNKQVEFIKNRSYFRKIWDFFTRKTVHDDEDFKRIYYSLRHEQKAHIVSLAYDIAQKSKNLSEAQLIDGLTNINIDSLNRIFNVNPEFKNIFIELTIILWKKFKV